MKALLCFIALLLTSLAYASWACLPASMPTDSKEPVTIKIADTYFQIPEGYLPFPFVRVPIERKSVIFYVPVTDLFPELRSTEYNHHTVAIILSTPEGGAPPEYIFFPLNDKTKAAYYPKLRGNGKDFKIQGAKVESYVKSISSQKEPDTWKSDSELASLYKLGEDPCTEVIRSEDAASYKISYENILRGLSHRNEAIRATATYLLKDADDTHRIEALARLQSLMRIDTSSNVRMAAATALIKMPPIDDEIEKEIINVMLQDQNTMVRSQIAYNIDELGGRVVELLVPLIKSAEESDFVYLGIALADIINNEVREKKLTSYDQLSGNAVTALQGIITILNSSKNPEVDERIINRLSNSRGAVASKEYVETLVSLLANGQEQLAPEAAASLSQLGEDGIVGIPLIIQKMETTKNLKELAGLILAIRQFKEYGKDAVPALIKLTTFQQERNVPSVPEPSITPWYIRREAVTALQFIGVKTPEVEAAFEAAARDSDYAVRYQAEAALKQFENFKEP